MKTAPVQLDAGEHLGRSLKRVMAARRRMRARETRRPGELSDAQYSLLFGLRQEGGLSLGELADAVELSPPAATEMLDSLASQGLVLRTRSESDRRVVLTSLTERGHELVEDRRARFEPLWRGALSEFSDEQLLSAAAVLDRLRLMFDELADERIDPVLEAGRDQAVD
jgi:MarR family transcriptional regulator, organic hydroperoxide resistance regulator